jgi:predicted cupin superfamily sugar epimerase
MMQDMNAQEIIETLQLERHPEGGWYRQTWVEDTVDAASRGDAGRSAPRRPSGTCIYFLLGAGEQSHWHRVDATEIWLYHAGAPLVLSLAATDQGPATDHLLTPNLREGRPQLIVPKDHWQAARSTGDWTLVSCTVSPGFDFSGFTLAPEGFDIPRA